MTRADLRTYLCAAVAIGSALAIVALTGCDCRDLERAPFVLRKSHCHPGQDWDWVLHAGRNGAQVCRCPGGAK